MYILPSIRLGKRAAFGLFLATLTAHVALGVAGAEARTNQSSRLSEQGSKLNRETTELTGPDGLLSPTERERLPLERYTVTDDGASYFDVAARREYIQRHGTPSMQAQAEQLSLSQSCADALNMPPMAHKIHLPGFYPAPKLWRQAAQPFFAFEDAVTHLAGGWVVTGETQRAECLTRMLAQWADAEAFTRFSAIKRSRQSWYAIESSLFAAGLAYSTITSYADRHLPEKAKKIEGWLKAASRVHISREESGRHYCCNNHFYRRAVHTSIIGVITEDDELFRYGVAAIYSALHEANDDGSLPRELMRGTRALHYQNYANIYLQLVAQIVQRQGYDIYDVEVGGRSLNTLANWAGEVLRNPEKIDKYVDRPQNLWFMDDPQYFAWMEAYIRDFPHPGMQKLLKPRRPTYNRSAGGFMTLYFRRAEPGTETTSRRPIKVGNAFVNGMESCAKPPRWTEKRDIGWRMRCEQTLRETPRGKYSTGAEIFRKELSQHPEQ